MSLLADQFARARPYPQRRSGIAGPGDPAFAHVFSDLLERDDLLDEAAIARAIRAAAAASERFDHVLVKLGLISEADLAAAYAAYCNLPRIEEADFPQRAILADKLKIHFLKGNRVLPVAFADGTLTLATADPFNAEPVRAIGYWLDAKVELAIATPADIESALRALYHDASEAHADATHAASFGDGNEIDIARLRDIANEAPIIRLVNQVIAKAVERGVSDIHIEPGRDAVSVRYRVDGFLQQERLVPAPLRAALTTRVKIMAKLDIAERRLPQDGRIKTPVRGVEVDIRVSTLPTVFGESIVMRILDKTRVELDFTRLGIDKSTQASLQKLMELPNGIVLVTGPTGSGKTTTLYTALKQLNRPELKLFTVEDPIEYQLSGINQIQVQPQIGLDFPAALRSILRQDPDIVMIGEIRDVETARIAIQASLTGHLVFSTLHTNSAVAAITRLVDIGVERYLLASTLSGVMAQRLVRRLCRHCSRPHPHRARLAAETHAFVPDQFAAVSADIREPVGCEACHGTGYSGRTTVCELLVIDDELRDAVSCGNNQHQLLALAQRQGYRSLYADGLAKVWAGETSIEEVLRVTRAQ